MAGLSTPLHEHHGVTGHEFTLTLTCPVCGHPMTWQNGVRYRTPSDVGVCIRVVFACVAHGAYELATTLTRAQVSDPRPSGAQQRARRGLRGSVPA